MDKKLLKLKEKKLAKMGQDYIISIPRIYIRNGIIDPKKIYNVYLEAIDEE